MSLDLDETHDPALMSWVGSANDPQTDFPIQNLPFGRFKCHDSDGWRTGVAIGDQILDLAKAGLVSDTQIEPIMQTSVADRRSLRTRICRTLLKTNSNQRVLHECLIPQAAVQMGLPCEIGDYTDFYAGIHHATAVGKLFRPDQPLLPNYKWVPIGYHGRTSSINVSPGWVKRPLGQQRGVDDSRPDFGPSRRLDYELELGFLVGCQNAQGEPIPMANAEDHLFGAVLLNDWSARDIQAWEYQPLGPFLSKNFASTVSPWIVTMEALAPFRKAFVRPAGDPDPLPYLDSQANRHHGAIDIELEVMLQTQEMRDSGFAGDRISRSNFTDAYWTAAQLVAHHTVNGCNLRTGDLLGTGTLSGPLPDQAGSLLELSGGGKQTLQLSNGQARTFLDDGDAVTLRGRCTRAGLRSIGFGACSATVAPAAGLANVWHRATT